MKNYTIKDIEGVIKRQRQYATLAENEGKYALKQESKERKKRFPEMAKDSAREAGIAFLFAEKRRKLADREAARLPKNRDKSSSS